MELKCSTAMKAMKVMKKPAKNAMKVKKTSPSAFDPVAARWEKDMDEVYIEYQELKSHNASFGVGAGTSWRECHVHVNVCFCLCIIHIGSLVNQHRHSRI